MMTRIFLILFLALPAFAENARRIERVSQLNEGSTVDPIVWYQGESVTLDIFAKWGTAKYAWPSTASSVLRVWVDGTPGTLYVDKTNDVYSASTGQTRNTLTPAQSNLATNDYKFSVAVYDSTTFMGIAAEGDLEVRYAPQTGLPMVTTVSIWPSELDDLADVAAPSPDAGQVLGFDGTNWVAVAAGSGSGDLTAITSTDGSITVTSGTGPIPNVALPSTLPARNGSLLTAINAAALGGVLPAGYATTNSVANAIAKAHDSVTQGAGDIGTLTGQVRAVTTNQVRAAVSGIYLPPAGGTMTGALSIPTFFNVPGQQLGFSIDSGQQVQFAMGAGFDGTVTISPTASLTITGTYTGNGSGVTNLNASAIASGTLPDARFPVTLPAVSGSLLTNINGANITNATPWHLATVTDWTGGTSADLDDIVTTTQRVGTVASFVETNSAALWQYTLTTGTDAENVPHVVRPDDYAASTNEKVWKLRSVHKNGSVCLYNSTDEKWHPLTTAISTTTVTTSLDQTGFFAPLNPILSGSLSYWKLDESAPSGDVSARDMVGTTHLTSNASVLSTTGKVANGRLFVTANSEYMSVASGSHSFAFGDQSFTAAAWVKMVSKPGYPCHIASVWNTATNNRCWTLLWDNSLDRFRMAGSAAGTATSAVISSSIGAPSLATWYFVVGGYDAANDVVFISVDGGAADTVALAGGLYGSSAAIFSIGSGAGAAFSYWDGTIDEVGIWNRRLTSDEITELYNSPGLP